MITLVLRRGLWSLLTLWAVVTVSFFLMRAAPGGPFSSDKPLPPAVRANLERTFGLAADMRAPAAGQLRENRVISGQKWQEGEVLAVILRADGGIAELQAPADGVGVRAVKVAGSQVSEGDVLALRQTSTWEQYAAAMTSYLRGDLGVTYASEGSRTVLENIAAGFSVSLELGLLALLVALTVGIGSGLLAGWRAGTWIDHVSMAGALAAVSLSTIVLGPLLVLVFCVQLRWLPWGGWTAWAWSDGRGLVKLLPALTLGLVYAAWFSRLVRAGVQETLRQPWLMTARAKGLSEWQVLTRHALLPSLVPALGYLGPALAGIVTGSVVVERIFAVPGIGESFVTAALNRDYPMVMGTVVLYAALLIGANLLVDVLHAAIDPRVRQRALGRRS